jgi:hypothetical protein
MGEHTQMLLSASRTTVMRVGYWNPKNGTLAPSTTQVSRSITSSNMPPVAMSSIPIYPSIRAK